MITTKILEGIFKHTKTAQLEAYVSHLNRYSNEYGINTKLRMAHFLAQTGHESGGFRATRENLNYSAEGLLAVFKKYFTPETAKLYARKPEKIGSRVYANRMGNGPEESGDGWKFRGVGLIQTTGKNNIEALSKKLGMSLDDAIRFAETPEGAVKAACIFWVDNNLNRFADKDDILGLTKAINGGTNGLDDRKELTERAKAALS